MKYSGTFLTWILFWLDLFLLAILHYFNFYTNILVLDTTFITHTIILVYLISNYFIFQKSKTTDSRKHEYISNILWWLTPALLSAGMLGTVIGFFVLTFDLFPETVDLNDDAAITTILAKLTNGLSIALITTITGLVTSNLLSLKLTLLHFIDQKFGKEI